MIKADIQKKDIAIIGAGPAGLMCALTAVEQGYPVSRLILLDKNRRPGAKLLLTGNGRCNLSQQLDLDQFSSHFYRDSRYVKACLRKFDYRDLTQWFKERKLELKSESGRIYPRSEKASDVLACFEHCLKQEDVDFSPNTEVVDIEYLGPYSDHKFALDLVGPQQTKSNLLARKIVLATGGLSHPKTGSDGFALRLAKKWKLPYTPPQPGLVGVILKSPFPQLSGLSLEKLDLSLHKLYGPGQVGKKIAQSSGSLLFTHRGLSGPAILNISREISRLRPQATALRIKWISPEMEEAMVLELKKSNLSFKDLLNQSLPNKLAAELIQSKQLSKRHRHLSQQALKHLSRPDVDYLIQAINQMIWPVHDVHGFGQAIITSGGLETKFFPANSFAHRELDGLYAVGETLDIDGECGGFNLQFAFSSGYVAGLDLAKQS